MEKDDNTTKCNIFLISTPLQFILATMIARQVEGRVRLIVVTDFDKSLAQIERCGQLLSAPHYEVIGSPIGFTSRAQMFIRAISGYRAILRIRSQVRTGDTVFIGFPYYVLNRPFFSRRSAVRFERVFFDDGTATINFLSDRKEGERMIVFKKAPIFFFTLFYPSKIRLDKLTYYTIYPGVSGGALDNVVHVKPRLPIVVQKRKRVNEVWFIGSPLVATGLIAKEKMVKLMMDLRCVVEAMGAKLVYFPHRTERGVDYIKGIELREPDLPFELYYWSAAMTPVLVTSVLSSAILNLKILFNKDINLMLIDADQMEQNKKIIQLWTYAQTVLEIPLVTASSLLDGINMLDGEMLS